MLKKLKDLKIWNKETFGNVFQNIIEAENDAFIRKRQYDISKTPAVRFAILLMLCGVIFFTERQFIIHRSLVQNVSVTMTRIPDFFML